MTGLRHCLRTLFNCWREGRDGVWERQEVKTESAEPLTPPADRRQSGINARFQSSFNVNGRFQPQNIGKMAESGDLPRTDARDEGFVPELLPCVNVGEVDFDGRN